MPTRGPSRGALLLQGGVGKNRPVDSAFVALAGGASAHIVVIPTASVGDAGPPGFEARLAERVKAEFGVARVSVLHTTLRASADSESFVAPLRSASGVWILGGFPPNLVGRYLGTLTERAIREVLDRGGVVAGQSAGAMIQASWLDTTDDEFTPEIRAIAGRHPGGAGFGLLTNAGIFPHFDTRGPGAAVAEIAAHPDQLAIGIDNAAALIVRGDRAEVVGQGTVSMYNGAAPGTPNVTVLRSGDTYDLVARRKR